MKFISATLLLLLPLFLNAQFLIGGSLNHRSYSSENTDQTFQTLSIVVSPEIAFQLSKNHLLGIRYSHSNYFRTINDVETENKRNTFSLFNRMRKPINEKLNFYGEIALSYSMRKYPDTNNLEEITKDHIYSIGAGPGLEFKLAKRILLYSRMGLLGFNQSRTVSEQSTIISNVIEIGLNPSNLIIGLNYRFGQEQ